MEREEAAASAGGSLLRTPRLVNSPGQPEPSPEQLAERSQAGCPESFEQLLLRYESPVFNFLHQLTRNRQDALDRLIELIRRAAVPPVPRRPTRPSAAEKRRRLESKVRRGATKRLRRIEPED